VKNFKSKLIRQIKNIFRYFGYDVLKLGNLEFLESLIYSHYGRDFFFVQIGANDGIMKDPIYEIVNELNLSGLVIEPVNEYYDELVKNYKNNRNVVPVNKAIYEFSQVLTFYKYKTASQTKDWQQGIASLIPKHHLKSGVESEFIEEVKADGITFSELFDLYNITKIDLLVIDTEGYDYNLLKLFPFDKFKPKIIQFEHGLPSNFMTKEQYSELSALLLNQGYLIITKNFDSIAYIPKEIK
jgi:FkbM family methyltransferase